VELGVHVTFVSLTNGRIDLKRIRFRYVNVSFEMVEKPRRGAELAS